MNNKDASLLFEALGSEIRLDIFRLLVKHAPEGLVAGEISEILEIPPTNLSFHLKAIVQSSLVTVKREGRYMRYKANILLMHKIIKFLTAECCMNNPEECKKYRELSQLSGDFLSDL